MSERITVVVDPDLADLIPGFLDHRQRDIVRLHDLLAARAYAEIRLIGHSMKGAGGGYGFDRITELGGELERAALDANESVARDVVARLSDYLTRIDVVYAD